MNLSFQISGRTTSIDITAEAALIDIASLNARGVSRLGATSIVLSGLYVFGLTLHKKIRAGKLPPYPDPRKREELFVAAPAALVNLHGAGLNDVHLRADFALVEDGLAGGEAREVVREPAWRPRLDDDFHG